MDSKAFFDADKTCINSKRGAKSAHETALLDAEAARQTALCDPEADHRTAQLAHLRALRDAESAYQSAIQAADNVWYDAIEASKNFCTHVCDVISGYNVDVECGGFAEAWRLIVEKLEKDRDKTPDGYYISFLDKH